MQNMLVAGLVPKAINQYLSLLASEQGTLAAKMALQYISYVASTAFAKFGLDGRWLSSKAVRGPETSEPEPKRRAISEVIEIKYLSRPKFVQELRGKRGPARSSLRTGVYFPHERRRAAALTPPDDA